MVNRVVVQQLLVVLLITGLFDDIITMYCIVLYSIKLNWRQCKVVFRVGTRNTNCDIQQQSNAIKRLYLVYETIVSLYTW